VLGKKTTISTGLIAAVLCCAVVSVCGRVLHALSITQRHLRFWQARLKAGSHSTFLLLSRGPGGFAADVLERLGVREQQQSGISASDRIEERVRNIIGLQL